MPLDVAVHLLSKADGLVLDLAHGSNPPASLSRLFDGEVCLSLPKQRCIVQWLRSRIRIHARSTGRKGGSLSLRCGLHGLYIS